MVLQFGNEGTNVTPGSPCLTFGNVGTGAACPTTAFTNSSAGLVFGPVPGPPGSAMTISHLSAAETGPGTGVTITVLDNGVATALTCANTTGLTCHDDVDTVTVQAGDFLAVEATACAGWLVTFELA
jgi:hypothetical protein